MKQRIAKVSQSYATTKGGNNDLTIFISLVHSLVISLQIDQLHKTIFPKNFLKGFLSVVVLISDVMFAGQQVSRSAAGQHIYYEVNILSWIFQR